MLIHCQDGFMHNITFFAYFFEVTIIQVVKQKQIKQTNRIQNSSNMSNTFLDEEETSAPEGKGVFSKYQLKIQHLNDLNKKIYIENEQLNSKVKDLEKEKMTFLVTQFTEDMVISSLAKELETERQKNRELSKQNQQLSATILLNEQLGIQTKKQFEFFLSRYEQKILQLRQNLQLKEVQIQTLEQKYEKFKALQLPISIKNANRYTAELLKYETLIENMIEQRNAQKLKNVEEIDNVLKYFEKSEMEFKKDNLKKLKSHKNIPCSTDVRSKLTHLTEEGQGPRNNKMSKDKLDVLFLRLHLELRELKRKYKQKIDDNLELKNKDKVMKQGYLTLTKEMEKVKIENCQLKIQLEHLDKKVKTSKEISRAKSTNNIPKYIKQKENAQQKISSEVSIQGNFSQVKQYLKATLPSQTKYDTFSANKSHNFDQRIQNIEGILSLDSDPDFSNLQSRKEIIKNEDHDENLSVCEENQLDMSISLDTSGFMAPNKSHHEISEHILKGLVDKRIF